MENHLEKTEDALELVHIRNAFYKKKFHTLLGIGLLALIVILCLMFLFKHLLGVASRPLYFVANDEGVLIQQSPLQLPIPIADVNAWVVEAIESANSFDYVNYRSQLQDSQKYFSDFAWMEYMKSLTASLNLTAMKERREVWISKVIATPTIINAGAIRGEYAWRVELTLRETRLKPPLYLNTPTSSSTATYKITVILQRKPLLQSYQGLAVLSMVKELISSSPRSNIITR
ncbi:MAG TPA: DotI/IcmL family type IV secretion protein [Gammaproteobacteria bacterium]|jgi:intracellular multiplication protein IcmL|nr:DotI/IcmL family type IV secretion protein [Gammaproteobacteria bacterium]